MVCVGFEMKIFLKLSPLPPKKDTVAVLFRNQGKKRSKFKQETWDIKWRTVNEAHILCMLQYNRVV